MNLCECIHVYIYIHTWNAHSDGQITSARIYTGLRPAAALQAVPPVLARARRQLAAPAARREYIQMRTLISLFIHIHT